MQKFAVTAPSFALYRVFKEECEKMGWTYPKEWIPFEAASIEGNPSLLFTNALYPYKEPKITGNLMGVSNVGESVKVFDLGHQYAEALAFAKQQIESKVKMRSAEEVVSAHRYAVDAVKTYATEAMEVDRAELKRMLRENGCDDAAILISDHPYPELP